MKNYRVNYTEAENGYCYTGTWDVEIVPAEDAEEAIELLKQYFREQTDDIDFDPDSYIYKCSDAIREWEV